MIVKVKNKARNVTAQRVAVTWRILKVWILVLLVSVIPKGIDAQENVEYTQMIPAKKSPVSQDVKNINDVIMTESLENLSILEIFKEIESSTNFRFAYDNNDLNKDLRITIDSEGKSIGDILSQLSNQTSLTFHQINNDIMARFKTKKEELKPKTAVDKTISGSVVDQNGQSVPGVNIVVKGTAIGTATDMNGKFFLVVPDNSDTLVVSYIGYITKEEIIGGRTTLTIQIEEDIRTLEEYVVIGYQTVRKQDLTGSVSVIDTRQAAEISTNSVVESLQGLAPGVTVKNGGKPGQMGDIEIRGIGSFRDKSPLYIIDGMYADPNSTINSNDIESIQILKDGSAAAIYGSRAANGVVIITTKKGKEGPAKISVSAKYGIQQMPKTWDVMNNQEFAAMQRRQYENSGLIPPPSVGSAFKSNINTDWQKEGYRTGKIQDYNATLSGGSKTSNYLVALSWFENEGVLIGNDFERVSLRINTSGKKGRFFFGENMVVTRTIDEAPATGNAFYDLPQLLPVIPVQDDALKNPSANNPGGWGYGTPAAPTYAWNYIAINDLFRNSSTFAKIVGNGYAGFDFTDYLQYKFNAGLEASFDRTKTVRKDGNWAFNQSPVPNQISEGRGTFSSVLLEHTLNFNKDFGKHHVDAVFGYTQQYFDHQTNFASRTNMQSFNGEYLTEIDAADGTDVAFGGVENRFLIKSLLGRANYIYDDRYLLTLTARRDGDSRFSEEYRYGFFPSVAAGWRISNESFFTSEKITNLQLYGSYGVLGINSIGPFEYAGFLNINPRVIFGPDQSVNTGAYLANLYNPDLRWESRRMINIGVTSNFLKDRLTVTLEVYNNLSEDALVAVPLAFYLGNLGGNPDVNAASIRNRGLEFSASYRQFEKTFKWEISGNVTTIQNEVMKIADTGVGSDYIQIGNSRSQVGHSLAEWYLRETDGIFQSIEEVNAHLNADGVLIQPNAKPGDIRFVDQNGDGQITDDDRTFRGSPWPTLQTGLQFNASYKQFSFSMQLAGVFGHMIYNDVRRVLDSYQNTNFRSKVNPWSPTNTNTDDPRIGLEADPSGNQVDPAIADNNIGTSDRWLENGSYVRLRNIEIGYNLPKTVLTKFKFESMRVYVSGQNLLTFTEYSGLDPDIPGGINTIGFDGGNWPASRIISVGLQANF